MGQFDNVRSIVMLFVGAFLVSLGVIAFLNIEIKSRSNYGTKIRNENIFEVLSRKISEVISAIRERNSHRRLILYHFLISENVTRPSMRKLQYFLEDSNSVNWKPEPSHNQTYHRLRHEKKMRRFTELRLKQKSNANVTGTNFGNGDVKSNTFVLNNTINQTEHWHRSLLESISNDSNREIFKEGLGAHRNCYTTNDVLEIIAITCLVNFIFWFLIILCVNFFTRNQKTWKSSSCESLVSVEIGTEYVLNQTEQKKQEEPPLGNLTTRYNVVHQDYIDPNAVEEEIETQEMEPQVVFSHKSEKSRKTLEKKLNNTKRRKQGRLINFPNIFFDMIFVDNLKPLNKKKFISRNRNEKMSNSLSMEDLIF